MKNENPVRILGIETTTSLCSVALIEGGGPAASEQGERAGGATQAPVIVAEYRVSLAFKHAERLLPLIDTLLKETRLTLSDVTAIAVSIGPGSFTGLRVGLATAKGLAIGSNRPLLPIPTLEAMAAPFCYANVTIAPLMLSRKGEVYWALFAAREGSLVRLHPDAVGSIQDVLNTIKEDRVLFVGNGAVAFRDQISKQLKGRACWAPLSLQSPLASSVAELGLSRFKEGETPQPETVVPIYLSTFTPKLTLF